MFLEISQNSQENTCARVSFLIKLQVFWSLFLIKLQALRPYLQNNSILVKKRYLRYHLLFALLTSLCYHVMLLFSKKKLTTSFTRLLYIYIGNGFESNSGQHFIATSKKILVINTMHIIHIWWWLEGHVILQKYSCIMLIVIRWKLSTLCVFWARIFLKYTLPWW